jgi:hypothetical protein
LKPREVEFHDSSLEGIASPIIEEGVSYHLVDERLESFQEHPRSVKTDGSREGAQALTPRPFQPSQVAMGSRTVDPRI